MKVKMNIFHSWNIPKQVEDEIQKRAEICMINEFFKKITIPYFSKFIISTDEKNQNGLSAHEPYSNSFHFQSYINHIVDLVLKEIINHLKKNHNEMIKIPNIDQKFKVGSGIFETNGRFTTTDGYFR